MFKSIASRGEQGGGTGPSREVFPLNGRPLKESSASNRAFAVGERGRKQQAVAQVTGRVIGRRTVPRAWWRHCSNGRDQQSRGVSDHAKWPLALPSLRPRTWSLTPRLNRLSVAVSAPKVQPVVREDSTRNLENNSMNLWAVFSHWLHVRCHARTHCRSSPKFPARLNDHSPQNIGHHMTRTELCSAPSRLSLRSTLRATALTAPARSSKVAFM